MKKTVISLVSVVLFFAASLFTLFTAGGYVSLFDQKHNQDGTSKVDSLLETDEKGTTTAKDPDVNNTPSKENGYLSSLRDALIFSDIEGLVKNRGPVSLQSRVELYEKLAGSVPSYDPQTDKISASGVYDREKNVIKLVKKGLYDEFTEGTEIVTSYSKAYSRDDGSYVTHSTKEIRARFKVVPYMGYLLVGSLDQEGTLHLALHGCDGKEIISDIGDKRPYYARNYDNLPVFVDSDSNFYSFDGEKFSSIKQNTIRVELFYDYPASPLARFNGKTEVRYLPNYNQYRFENYKNGGSFINARYAFAFNFSENGLAVVMLTTNNTVRIINTSARSQLASTAWHIFPGTNMYVQYFFALPDTLGIESIGSSGFDNGWLRIRVRALSRMSNSYDTVVNDVSKLINEEGEYFDIPEGYTLEGYSNGVLLLSKDGLYGYYSINGYWIAQPIYDYARPFVQGLAAVGYKDGTMGMIDTEGNIVLPLSIRTSRMCQAELSAHILRE